MSPPDSHPLAGQSVFVLGGSSGIGLAAAQAAAGAGGHVTISSRSPERLERALAGLPPGTAAIALDATEYASMERSIERVGPIDQLVLSVGIVGYPPTPFSSTPLLEARAAFEHHFWAAVQMLHACLPFVPSQARSSITFVTGGLARRPIQGKSYTTSYQQALEGLARALVDELAPIRVNVLRPGLCDTALWQGLGTPEHESLFGGAACQTPVGFIPDAAPIGQAILSMMTTTYISGASLAVDGGWAQSRLPSAAERPIG